MLSCTVHVKLVPVTNSQNKKEPVSKNQAPFKFDYGLLIIISGKATGYPMYLYRLCIVQTFD